MAKGVKGTCKPPEVHCYEFLELVPKPYREVAARHLDWRLNRQYTRQGKRVNPKTTLASFRTVVRYLIWLDAKHPGTEIDLRERYEDDDGDVNWKKVCRKLDHHRITGNFVAVLTKPLPGDMQRSDMTYVPPDEMHGYGQSASSAEGMKIHLKYFYKWLAWQDEMEQMDPKKVGALPEPRATENIPADRKRMSAGRKKQRGSEEIITLNDAQALSASAASLGFGVRDEALVYTLWETGFAIEEFLSLNWGDLTFYESGQLARVEFRGRFNDKGELVWEGKTEHRTRAVLLAYCTPVLKQWWSSHPLRGYDDAPLWMQKAGPEFKAVMKKRFKDDEARMDAIDRGMDPDRVQSIIKHDDFESVRLAQHTVREMLEKLQKITDFRKPMNPHWFRHSRATYIGDLGASDRELREYMGWAEGSEMPRTYVHSDENSRFRRLAELQGIEGLPKELKEGAKRPEIAHLMCRRGHRNPKVARFCMTCSIPLSADREAPDAANQDRVRALHSDEGYKDMSLDVALTAAMNKGIVLKDEDAEEEN